MTPEQPTIGGVAILIDGGLITFGHANLRTTQSTSQRQNEMAPPDVPDSPAPTSPVAADAHIRVTRPSFFLRTKLLAPRPAPELLSRPRLTDRLLANLSYPVTLVTANAGSGKTTLVADFLRTHKRQFVWYQLDHTDADPSVFLGYLGFGIKQQVPGFGDAMFSYLQEATGELAQHPERAVDVFLNEVLERVEQQLILVLDDYHHLGSDTAVHAVLDRLLAYLPDVLHVIIISREMPPLSLGRLRTHSPLSSIDRSDLLFTDEETQELFRRVFDLELTPEQLAEYRERTHGWITALQLVRQVAHRNVMSNRDGQAGPPDLVEVLRQSERDIFDYFAEEVFSDEEEDVQKLLLRVSLLDRIELDACASLYQGLNCARVLPNLVRRNVFISVASDRRGEEYRLHPLFQNFLRRRLRSDIGRTGVAAEHQRCATYFMERQSWEQAVRHLLAVEDFAGAAKVIAESGSEWISSGALGSLASLADSLPQAAVEAHPRALAHRAEVARLRGEYESARSLLRRAAALLHERDDKEGEADTLHSLATLARRQGDYELAFTYLDSAIVLSGQNSAVRTKCGNTRGLCLFEMSEWTASEREFRAALQSAEERNDEHYIRLITHNLGLPAMMRGDFGEALKWLSRMLRKDAQAAPMPQEAVAHLNMARCQIYRGDFAAAEQHLDSALERCQLFNLVVARAETFETYGNLYRERGEIERAIEYYERAARAYDEAGISLNRTEWLEERALLSLQIGDFASARSQTERLIAARPVEKEQRGFFTALLTRGRIMVAQGEHEAARHDGLQALAYFHGQGLYFYEAQASALIALCDLHLGKEPEMIERLKRAIELAVRYDYEYWLKRQLTNHPQLFSSEEALELLPTDLREEVQSATKTAATVIPAQVSENISDIGLHPKVVTDLTVNMLGPVEIQRDPTRPLAADAWPTRRARDILCFIVSRRHRRASKDSIIDTFWGETDFEAVEKNFHPTVSHIRKALNSNQPLKQNFLLYRDGDYQLNSEFSYRIDTEEFDQLLTEGENARRARQFEECIRAYDRALLLYRGEFMQGSYEPWVEEQRTYYREQYLRVLEALAGVAQTASDWPRAMQLAQLIIREDQFREDIHCVVMRAQAALGNRGAVKEHYEGLKRLLQSELGVDPSAETRKLYRELIG
ncbi:MAG TPA: BTAD domain-containing putative transcriptional regulator [Pyrinomonadaceae bacterium]|nr:BTAD domain-containing putative transcriptional regulator [Pyrinomonadaceae bacterium]